MLIPLFLLITYAEKVSSNLLEFLECLGTRTPVQEDIYSGDLLGYAQFFYSATFHKNTIAFHVGPEIDQTKTDPIRKKHIGNDLSGK